MDAVGLRLSGRQRARYRSQVPSSLPGRMQILAGTRRRSLCAGVHSARDEQAEARATPGQPMLMEDFPVLCLPPNGTSRPPVVSFGRRRHRDGVPPVNNFFTPIFRLTKHHPLPWVPLRAINVPIEPPQAFASRNRCVALPPGIRACFR